MKLSCSIFLYGYFIEGSVAAISLYEFSLENLNSPQQRLVVFWDVVDLVIEKLDGFVSLGQLNLEVDLLLSLMIQLLLQADYLLLEN